MSIERISTNFAGNESEGSASGADISSSGRYIVYVSDADDIVGGHASSGAGVYVRDMETGQVERIDRAFGGGPVDGSATNAKVSGDGRYVTYTSTASNLVAGGIDDNGSPDVFVYDRMTQTTRLISTSADGSAGSGGSHVAGISDNGRYIAYFSEANDIDITYVGDQTDNNTLYGSSDLFIHDMVTGETKLVTRVGSHVVGHPSVKIVMDEVQMVNDAGYALFTAYWTSSMDVTLRVAAPGNTARARFWSNHATAEVDTFTEVRWNYESRSLTIKYGQSGSGVEWHVGGQFENDISGVALAANGRFVAYTAAFDQDGNYTGGFNLYLFDAATGQTVVLALAVEGDPFRNLQISADGGWVTFESDEALTSDDDNGKSDVFRVANPFGRVGNGGEGEFPDGDHWIVGTEQSDDLKGTDATDHISALEGDDLVEGYDGGDTIMGAGGQDKIYGGSGVDRIAGGDQDDTLHGDASLGSDHGIGGSLAGDDLDFIEGGAGNDRIYGNGGDDRLNGGAGHDVILGGDGEDVIYGGRNETSTDDLFGGGQGDIIHGDDGNDAVGDSDNIYGEGGRDFLFGDGGDDNLFGEADADLLVGGDGKDKLVGGSNAVGRDELFGGEGDDVLHGDGEADGEASLEGNDDLDGGAGSDTLHGRGGHDKLIGGSNEDGYDNLFGGAGDDKLYGDREDEPDSVQADDGRDILHGDGGNDTLVGNGGEDELWGGADSDIIDGGADADYLFGGTADNGFDHLEGGAGNDFIFGDFATLGDDLQWRVIESSRDSKDYIRGGIGQDRIYGGGADDEIWGDEDLDFIDGGSGNDTIIGGVGSSDGSKPIGAEGIIGGIGNDLLIGDSAESDENLNFVALETADDDRDILHGDAGNDEIYGCGGDDLLDGGADRDILVGGTGSDTILGDEGEDILYADRILEGSYPGLKGFASRGQSQAASAAASEDRDLLDGGAGDDTLHAGRNSTLIGGAGRDTFVLGFNSAGSVIEDLTAGPGGDRISLVGILGGVTDNWDGETNLFATGHLKLEARGADTVLLFDADGAVGSGEAVELATVAGVAPTALTGTNLVIGDYGHVIIDPTRTSIIQGTEAADILFGTEGNDTIVGLFGDDEIRGRGGDDDLSGGYGSDTLYGEAGNDLLRGGYFNDVLDGGDGDDILIGGSGDDTLVGGVGNDTLHLDGGAEIVSGGSGSDTFVASRYFGGEDVILDFQAGPGGGDVIDLTQLSDVYSFEQLQARLGVDAAGDVRITIDARRTYLTLKDVKPGELAADDFRFAPDPNAPDPVNRAPTAISIDDATVTENAPADTVIGRVTGSDPDGDTLVYSLVDDAGGLFVIDPATGVVTTRQSFDHEATASFDLVVRATDAGGLFVERTVTVLVDDLNEAPLDLSMDGTAVAENAAAGTLVGTVSASDPDGDALVYSLADDAGGLFVIDPATGVVTTTRAFDHEAEASFDIVVRATDAGGLFVDSARTVTIGDVNEAPTSIALDGDRVRENAAAGAVVGTAAAEDPEGDAIVYSLADDAEGRFRIDSTTGRITTTRAFDYEATPSLQIIIRAMDATGAWVDREATIAVEDVNEGPIGINDGPLLIDEDAASANLWSLLLANDVSGGGALSIASVNTTGAKGSVIFDAATRTLRYVADADAFDLLAPGATATDAFTYTVTDASGLTSTATVTFTVRGVADGRVIKGGNGKDTLTGTAGEDVIAGLNGNDILYGLDGADRLDGGNGVDKLYGGNGIDALAGGNGDDLLDGGAGADTLDGGHGQDQLFGGAGDDFIISSNGNDLLTGGAGADTFVFGISSDIDKILDFEAGRDSLSFVEGAEVLFHEILDNNNDGKLDTVLVHSLGGVVILLGVEYPVGPSLEEYLQPVWNPFSPKGPFGESSDHFL